MARNLTVAVAPDDFKPAADLEPQVSWPACLVVQPFAALNLKHFMRHSRSNQLSAVNGIMVHCTGS